MEPYEFQVCTFLFLLAQNCRSSTDLLFKRWTWALSMEFDFQFFTDFDDRILKQQQEEEERKRLRREKKKEKVRIVSLSV